jgi:hypothetical protein
MRSLLVALHLQTMTCAGRLLLIHVPAATVFFGRNVHPSSRLLQCFPGSAGLPPGTLLISSQGVMLCSCMPAAAAAASPSGAGSSAEAAAAAATPGSLAVRKVQLLQWQLAGVPLSCVALPGSSSYVVGDDRAGEAV